MPATDVKTEDVFWANGYTLDDIGIRIWPFRSHRQVWANLSRVKFFTAPFKGKEQFHLQLEFGDTVPKLIKLTARGGMKNFRKVARALRAMQAARPEVPGLHDPLVLEALEADKGCDETMTCAEDLPPEMRLNRARLRLAALEPSAAIKDCALISAQRPDLECAAARIMIRAQLLLLLGNEAQRTLDELLRRHPEELPARALLAIHFLHFNDQRGVALAEAVVQRNITESRVLVGKYASYLIWHRQWAAAENLVARLAHALPHPSAEDLSGIEEIRGEISRLRSNPGQAFRELTVAPKLRILWFWVPILAALLLYSWPLLKAGPFFYREFWHLRLLREQGVKADLVEIGKIQDPSSPDVNLTVISYRFAPDKDQAAKMDFLKNQLTDEDLNSPDFLKKVQQELDEIKGLGSGHLPAGWYGGDTIVVASTGKEIETNPALQYVTYLPGHPEINTIGPITNNRIWFTWLGAPKAFLPGLVVAGYLIYWAGQRLYRRLQGKR